MDVPFDFKDVSHRYIVGIDLGTTNSALAYVDRNTGDRDGRRILFFDIPQLVAPGEVGRRPVLPSFLYLPGPYELPRGSTALPWDSTREYAVGEFAREQGFLVPGRMVSSAKSWLCHGGVDRTAAILPWGSGADVAKVSPVEASARYLQHMREAWNAAMARDRDGCLLEEQLVILTVPASFDETARELTVAAARQAGIPKAILVEEPLAAFYAWLSMNEDSWQSEMRPGQLILVCDVGGGTTDFTIVAVRQGETGLRFDRLAVGDHLMLGGDNMDLSLARCMEAELVGQPGQLDSRRWHQLWRRCGKAKEKLLGDPAAHLGEGPGGGTGSVDITVMGTGRKLIADTMKGTLTRARAEELILEGFFPPTSLTDAPKAARRTGLTEWGLPFVQDAAVTRHMAAFWQRFRDLLSQETGRTALYPDYILFNGGALTPPSIRKRMLDVVGDWFEAEAGEGWKPVELDNPHPDLAVAVGAAYYGMVRIGEGVRVGAGSPRAYYVGVSGGAERGVPRDGRLAVCIVPRGSEEGFEAQLGEPAFEALTNQPAAFQIISSSTRLGDRLGDVVTLSESEITPLPLVRTVLRFGKRAAAQTLPVRLATRLTEIGTLELWCRSQKSPHNWQLQFDVRQQGEPSAPAENAGETIDANTIDLARNAIRTAFEGTEAAGGRPTERLTKDLVSILEMGKEKWPTPLVRKLADALLECRRGRSLSPQHEARWFNLLGFCLRPGFGDPLDEWRIKEIWKIYPAGLEFPRQAQGRAEWWIFWRRIAGGLSAGHQWHVYQQVFPSLQADPKRKKKAVKTLQKASSSQEEYEMWMMLANFERLPANNKVELGRLLLNGIRRSDPRPQGLWTLSRFGARIPFYGPLDQVIPSEEASRWMHELLSLGLEATDALAQVMIQLCRRTGDRERDLLQENRDRVSDWFAQLPRADRYREILNHPEASLLAREQEWIFGESLPAGIVLSSQPSHQARSPGGISNGRGADGTADLR